MKAILRLTAAVLLTLGSRAAIAHGGETDTGGFVSGILHPLTGIDHLAALLALGLWCSQRRTNGAWRSAVAFVVMMTLGTMLAYSGVAFPGVEIAIAASCVVIGAAIMNDAPASTLVAVIVSAFGLAHGYEHGVEIAAGGHALSNTAGFVLASCALILAGAAFGSGLRSAWRGNGLRAAGAVAACVGLWLTVGFFP